MSDPIRVDLKKLFEELKQTTIEADKPSKEWFTCKQFAEVCGVKNNRASVLIRRSVKQGKLEMRMFKIKSGRVVRPIPHYRKRLK